MSFNWQSGDLNAVDYNDCPDDPDKSGVHWKAIDGPGATIGQTRFCEYASDPTSIKTFQIKFDKDESWYLGTGTPASSALDLWSVAAHEFGHATGPRPSSWCNSTASS
jgi:hypothetical protein